MYTVSCCRMLSFNHLIKRLNQPSRCTHVKKKERKSYNLDYEHVSISEIRTEIKSNSIHWILSVIIKLNSDSPQLSPFSWAYVLFRYNYKHQRFTERLMIACAFLIAATPPTRLGKKNVILLCLWSWSKCRCFFFKLLFFLISECLKAIFKLCT